MTIHKHSLAAKLLSMAIGESISFRVEQVGYAKNVDRNVLTLQSRIPSLKDMGFFTTRIIAVCPDSSEGLPLGFEMVMVTRFR